MFPKIRKHDTIQCAEACTVIMDPYNAIHFESSNNTCSLAEVGGILYYILVIQSILNPQIIPAPLQRWEGFYTISCNTIHFES